MTISSINNDLNIYIHDYLKNDLQRIHKEALSEISKTEKLDRAKFTPVQNRFDIQDEYVPSIKPKVEVTLEERLEQVISPEEIKNLLSLIVKAPRIYSTPGQLVDVKG